MLVLSAQIRSVTGPHRADNQDSAASADRWVLVADGVGGHAGGDVASTTIVQVLRSLLQGREVTSLDAESLRDLVARANARMGSQAAQDPALRGMSTTFTGVVCSEGEALVAHIGDSRAYLVSEGLGRRVTRDDSLVQELVDSGAISEGQAHGHPHRNVITRSLSGSDRDAHDLTVLSVPLRAGDRWLVASDGLTDYVQDKVALGILARTPDPAGAADALVAAALERGSRDNVTVAVADVVSVVSAPGGPGEVVGAAATAASQQ
ncbi:PP2C family protein-serine/threonine phosphatase [Cellulomonas bogoriensis]|uniref:Serine/threonine protein phosphatase n=1 Tax=Cellulomonas bogoriensis 69B4 = DSM 16987 TaxID=1386082 RepID=A0A0A0BZW8_9CELL|nr:protein phosphatase 2C domain-containing protein [Cellulomonas bogoriensis]KGM13490.1 serine/threonine protein phosphatase [Cellulomonas bogoriensis 69B4 = DSM 16987]